MKTAEPIFPSTRYHGSKSKLIHWIIGSLELNSFDSVLDAFGGTGVVAYHFKKLGKRVTYNDYLKWNVIQAIGLIENPNVQLTSAEIDELLVANQLIDGTVARHFEGIYFTQSENVLIDTLSQRIRTLPCRYKQALAHYALFQSCIIKRPYNLFHRKNLYVRLAEVKRSFGNKTSWDTPIEVHFRKFAEAANQAVFDNTRSNSVSCQEVLSLPQDKHDLVYLDPPYMSHKGVSVDYHGFYHFLEGLADYDNWETKIDLQSKHRRLLPRTNPINHRKQVTKSLGDLFDHFRQSTMVLSYRSAGIPSLEELTQLLRQFKKRVTVHTFKNYQYVLSKQNNDEVLLVAE